MTAPLVSPPPPPGISNSAHEPGRPASLPKWIRERLEAQVAAGEAAARALAIADAPELPTALPPAPSSAGEPASTPDLPVVSSGVVRGYSSCMRFSEIGAEGDPVAPGLRSHVVRKTREEAESEKRTQKSRELREAPTPEEGE